MLGIHFCWVAGGLVHAEAPFGIESETTLALEAGMFQSVCKACVIGTSICIARGRMSTGTRTLFLCHFCNQQHTLFKVVSLVGRWLGS